MIMRRAAIAAMLIISSMASVRSQTLDSALAYFPMAVGDTWEYSAYWGMTAATQFQGYLFMWLTGDTVMPNGKHYFVLRNGSGLFGLFSNPAYLRLDSSTANVKNYDTIRGQEYTWDSLLALPGTLGHHGLVYLNNKTVLGIPTVTRSYSRIFDNFSVSYGFGVTDRTYITEYQEEYAYKIVYAKIGRMEYGTLMGVAEPIQKVPAQFELLQNYPNPFNPTTTIRYALPHRSHVTLTVFNALGQQVATLVNENEDAGYHELKFDGSNLSSGVYFYQLQTGRYVETKKLLLVR